MAAIFPLQEQFLDSTGLPLAAGTLEFFEAGTLVPLNIYSTAAGDIPLTNPLVLNAEGRVPAPSIWGQGNYDVLIKDSDGTVVYNIDSLQVRSVETGLDSNFVYKQGTTTSASLVAIPIDNTIPLASEGGLTTGGAVTIAPRFSTSKLKITVNILFANSGATQNGNSVALFRDNDVEALYAMSHRPEAAGNRYQMTFMCMVDALSTDATTFYTRFGTASVTGSPQMSILTSLGVVCGPIILVEEII